MASTTKLELQQLLTARNSELEAARLRIAELEGDVRAAKAEADMFAKNALNFEMRIAELEGKAAPQPAAPKPAKTVTKTVYEFDPRIAGDFARASKLARENNGVVRRITQ